jgi:hypothetical protein
VVPHSYPIARREVPKNGTPRFAWESGRSIDNGYVNDLLVRATLPVRLMPHEMTHAHGHAEGGEVSH